ncbi:uncharacterized protein LOC127011570 [Drosophila biarmipes]|uniref:uncharacterized protein LOC127011570 n=1 Tax=Drosophila biarmipes TaxID=125945 RepID=UPI0021CC65DF|nr:uncharacterized protein LOC127011570 [Drosophila biarmipes]
MWPKKEKYILHMIAPLRSLAAAHLQLYLQLHLHLHLQRTADLHPNLPFHVNSLTMPLAGDPQSSITLADPIELSPPLTKKALPHGISSCLELSICMPKLVWPRSQPQMTQCRPPRRAVNL